jgi:cytochrome c oxidase assembly protein subunit 15
MRKILWATLVYTLIVILWGAWVRISHSGDGCGASWPLCHGEVIPSAPQAKTWVEYAHRAMSGVYGLLILGLTATLHRRAEISREAKFWMKLTLLFMITEALLGARLVLGGLVGQNDTPARALVMSLHFLNSLFLTGSLTLTALFSGARTWRRREWSEIKGVSLRLLRRIPAGALVLFLFIGMTGTVATLSNTLYPADSLLAGLFADLDPNAHYLVRLRGLHPTLGFFLGAGLTVFFYLVSEAFGTEQPLLRNRGYVLSLGFAATVIVGAGTLLLHAPVPMKLLHLAFAHGLWVLLLGFWHALRFESQA